jgi:hypothetical protein
MIPRLGKLGASSFGSCTIQNWQHPTLTKGILLCNAAVNNDPRHQDVLLQFGIATWQKKSNKKGPPNVPVLEDVPGNTEYQKWLDGENQRKAMRT